MCDTGTHATHAVGTTAGAPTSTSLVVVLLHFSGVPDTDRWPSTHLARRDNGTVWMHRQTSDIVVVAKKKSLPVHHFVVNDHRCRTGVDQFPTGQRKNVGARCGAVGQFTTVPMYKF